MIGEMSNTGVPAESIFGGVKGAAVRQMSGGTLRLRVRQARAATQWGRKARMGLPEFTPVKNYKFLPGDPEMYNGDPVAKSLIL